VVTLFLIFLSQESLAMIDSEVATSRKCVKTFSHFERKYDIPLDTLHSISLKESGKAHSKHKIKVVWPWSVNVEGKGYFFNSKQEAMVFVREQMLNGKENIDIGCMQINLKYHPNAFTSLNQAFDPKRNIDYGARFLKSKYNQLGDWHKAIASYHSSNRERGFKYKQDVFKIANLMDDYNASLRSYIHKSKAIVTKKNKLFNHRYKG
jgi:soluble lytic murein transglycosylase-like protein